MRKGRENPNDVRFKYQSQHRQDIQHQSSKIQLSWCKSHAPNTKGATNANPYQLPPWETLLISDNTPLSRNRSLLNILNLQFHQYIFIPQSGQRPPTINIFRFFSIFLGNQRNGRINIISNWKLDI